MTQVNMVKILKVYFLLFLSGLILAGCFQANDLTMKCDGKVSLRSKEHNQNVEMVFRIKNSKIHQINNDGYILIAEDGMRCNISNEIISCHEKKELDSVSGVERSIKINRINGVIETISKSHISKTEEILGTDIFIGKCKKITNAI